MTTIRLLANVGEHAKGAVVSMNDDRARRLIRMGYAEAAPPVSASPTKKKK